MNKVSAREVREKYIKFFTLAPRSHAEIDPAPLVLESDPTTLFTSAGMQPLVPYLMGEKHPKGKRLVNSQPSIRLGDIEEVGDNRHTTFFEMLGNWSLGDYFKDEQLHWIYEFFTKELSLSKEKLWVSVFEGNKQVSRDEDSFEIWKKIGIPESRIVYYPAKKNWWSMTGTPEQMQVGHIGGPDSEVFYDFGEDLGLHDKSSFKDDKCHPNCDCGRFLEIGNSVFIQYKKVSDTKLEELPQKNVDFGGGLERITAAVNNNPDIFKIDVFEGVIKELEEQVNKKYENDPESFRIIADHVRAATFLAGNGVAPSNKQHGYVMRRLVRRSVVKARKLKGGIIEPQIFVGLVSEIISAYSSIYFKDGKKEEQQNVVFDEVNRFTKTLEKGFSIVRKIDNIDGKIAFDLYQTYGFPLEITTEIFEEKGQKINREVFNQEFEKHKEQSRTTSAGVFKGGLADHSPEVVKLHTATHLLLATLRKVLGDHVVQKGQNITKERSRFDFPHPQKMTNEELEKVEEMMNRIINENLPVNFVIMPKDEAINTGAIHAFNEKYSDMVKVYYVGDKLENAYSKEFCGGPHVTQTGQIGHVRIKKQESIGSGLNRIYLIIETS